MTTSILREQWAADVSVKSSLLRGQLAVARAGPVGSPGPSQPRQDAITDVVTRLLDTADQEVLRRRRGPIARWRGTSVALAYQSLHAAETSLIELMPEDWVTAQVPGVVRRAQAVLDRSDPQRAEIERLAQRTDTGTPAFRAQVQEAMEVGYDAADQMHVRVRNFRNMLIFCAALILVLMIALVALVAFQPEVLPMCFDAPAPDEPACPSGAAGPSSADVPIVAGLGLIGGALAAAFSIRNLRGTSTPYDVPIALALLKPPLGALTAVSGMLLLGGDFIPGFTDLNNQQQILAYALLFGYGQQLVSRLIDNQARDVLNKLPAKDPQGEQPAAAAVAMPPSATEQQRTLGGRGTTDRAALTGPAPAEKVEHPEATVRTRSS
ncbi:hypothetical protein AB0F81_40305 [Actinoplanes sp. NPDC024001]|uniref:hypothetical protein n=1 Tax=Actinoplanes sp. NPDC024001 TaxID=3154598 RepID=UPI003403C20B